MEREPPRLIDLKRPYGLSLFYSVALRVIDVFNADFLGRAVVVVRRPPVNKVPGRIKVEVFFPPSFLPSAAY